MPLSVGTDYQSLETEIIIPALVELEIRIENEVAVLFPGGDVVVETFPARLTRMRFEGEDVVFPDHPIAGCLPVGEVPAVEHFNEAVGSLFSRQTAGKNER
jgi:hypothetical protein